MKRIGTGMDGMGVESTTATWRERGPLLGNQAVVGANPGSRKKQEPGTLRFRALEKRFG
jgi:hypothetical protein